MNGSVADGSTAGAAERKKSVFTSMRDMSSGD